MTSAELPVLHQGELDAAAIDQLLTDITSLGEVLEVQVKRAPLQRAQATPSALPEARRLLAEGEATAIQIRYAFAGQVWVDTLLRTATGARVIRMAVPKAPDV